MTHHSGSVCFALPLVFVRKSVLVSFFVKCKSIYIWRHRMMLLHCLHNDYGWESIAVGFVFAWNVAWINVRKSAISVDWSRGFVAPNTGDRLCGITVCASDWYSFVRQHLSLLMVNARMPYSCSSWFVYLATFLAISHAASQPWRRLSVVGSRHVLDQQGESDDLDDTPFWYSVCFALPLVFVRKSVLVSFFCQMQIYLHLTS